MGRGKHKNRRFVQRCDDFGYLDWPGSVFEFHKVFEPLSRDFHVVAPSIPGFGFSEAPQHRGFHAPEVRSLLALLLAQVG